MRVCEVCVCVCLCVSVCVCVRARVCVCVCADPMITDTQLTEGDYCKQKHLFTIHRQIHG